jgi:cephalosporin hydroxylase
MSIWADFLTNDSASIYKWTHYFTAYERHFSRFRNQSITMIEIGCGRGGSVQMWKRFFGPFAQIVGIDIRSACKSFEERQIAIRIGDQSDPQFLDSIVTEFGPIDIVLDDGSHQMAHMLASFQALYPKLQRNGVYMVEDMQTCYRPEYGGGLRAPGTFMEACKDMLDELHADHTEGALPQTDFNRQTVSMHFYDGVVVFEKGRHFDKQCIRIPNTKRARKRARLKRVEKQDNLA